MAENNFQRNSNSECRTYLHFSGLETDSRSVTNKWRYMRVNINCRVCVTD